MKLWRRMVGKETAEEREARVRAVLESCAAAPDPRRALQRLARVGRAAPDLAGLGSVLHGSYRSAVASAWQRSEPDQLHRALPTASARAWRSWPVAKVSDLAAWARGETAEALALLEEEGRAGGDAMLQLQALRLLGGDERLAMVVVDGLELFVRRRFLLQAGSSSGGGVEEVVQELADGAAVLGYRVRSL